VAVAPVKEAVDASLRPNNSLSKVTWPEIVVDVKTLAELLLISAHLERKHPRELSRKTMERAKGSEVKSLKRLLNNSMHSKLELMVSLSMRLWENVSTTLIFVSLKSVKRTKKITTAFGQNLPEFKTVSPIFLLLVIFFRYLPL
jgi:hypothetical protein